VLDLKQYFSDSISLHNIILVRTIHSNGQHKPCHLNVFQPLKNANWFMASSQSHTYCMQYRVEWRNVSGDVIGEKGDLIEVPFLLHTI